MGYKFGNEKECNETAAESNSSDIETLYFARIPAVRDGIIAFYAVLLLASTSFNLLLIIAISTRRELRRSGCNMFILNLMVADVCYCCTGLMFTPVGLLFEASWWSIDALCKIVPMTAAASVHVISLCSMAIAIDRCWCTIRVSRSLLNTKDIGVIVFFIWIWALLVSVPIVQHSRTTGYRCVESWDVEETLSRRLYTLSCFIMQFILPAVVISVCYIRTVHYIRRRYDSQLARTSFFVRRRLEEKVRKKKSLLKLAIAIIACFIASFTPLNVFMTVVDFHHNLVHESRVSLLLFLFAHACTSLSTIANPILYGCLNTSFQRYLKRRSIFRYLFFPSPPNSLGQQSSKFEMSSRHPSVGNQLINNEDGVVLKPSPTTQRLAEDC